MKRLLSVLTVLIVIASVCTFADAASAPRIIDDAGLLDGSEYSQLIAYYDDISESLGFDIVAVTTASLGGDSAQSYADDFYDRYGYGFGSDRDGALLLISVDPNDRRCHISTCGEGITAINDNDIERMLDEIVDGALADGDYYLAVRKFAGLCRDCVNDARSGQKVTPTDPDRSKEILIRAAVTVGVALIVALIRISVMKSKMKSVRMQAAADSFVVAGSLQINNSADIFLYRQVSRVKREHNNNSGSSTHSSSSGTSHGGGGRSF